MNFLRKSLNKFFCLTIACFLYCQGFTQNFQIINQKTFGGISNEYVYRGEKCLDGGYIVGSATFSSSSGDIITGAFGAVDYLIVKFDVALNVEWQSTIGGSSFDVLRYIIATSDSGFLCMGGSNSPISGDKTDTSYNNSDDFWIVKLNANGTINWQKTIGGPGVEAANSSFIYETGSGYLIAGESNSDSSLYKSENARGLFDYWIINLDFNGNIIWEKTLGGSGMEYFNSLTVSPSGSIYVAGSSQSPASFDKTENFYGGFGVEDCWIIKLDKNGNKIWDKTVGGDWTDVTTGILYFQNELYVLAYSVSDSSGTKSSDSKGLNDYWVTKLDTLGNIIWDKTIGGNSLDNSSGIMVSADGEIILSGSSASQATFDKTEPSQGQQDYWLVAIDTTGSILWQKTIGGSDIDFPSNTIEVNNNHYMMFGYSKSGISGDKTDFSRGEEDIWLVELNNDVGIYDLTNKEIVFEAYPNPANEYIKFYGTKSINALSVFDITGKKIVGYNYKNADYVVVPLSVMSNGYYVASITTNESLKPINIKFVVAR